MWKLNTGIQIGHSNDLGKLNLTESEKKSIAAKLANKVPISAVLHDIRDSISNKLERINLLTQRDF